MSPKRPSLLSVLIVVLAFLAMCAYEGLGPIRTSRNRRKLSGCGQIYPFTTTWFQRAVPQLQVAVCLTREHPSGPVPLMKTSNDFIWTDLEATGGSSRKRRD